MVPSLKTENITTYWYGTVRCSVENVSCTYVRRKGNIYKRI